RARDILKMIKADPYLGSVICNCEAITEAEIRYCIRNEWAYTIDDLRRRTRLGMGPCQGMRCASTAAAILGDELGWDSVKIKEETVKFLQERWKGKRPLLDGAQIAQEELNQAVHHSL
ncbi:MAG: glycerol-3-phosphate dehydrogenase C-terminal domain-containing protein, partial [Nitrospirota bacterium]